MITPNRSLDEINTVLLTRKSKLLVDPSFASYEDNQKIILMLLKDIEDLGFIFSQGLFERLRYQSEAYLIDLHKLCLSVLSEMVGAHVEHKPFYKNFPQQMASLSDLDIYMNALVHYWTDGAWQPAYVQISRLPLEESQPQTRVIELGHISDFHEIFSQMMRSKGSLAAQDNRLLSWYIRTASPDDLLTHLPETIPSKEILSLVVANVLDYHPARFDLVKEYLKTATDMLRIITALSGGDVSLATNTQFRNFNRPQRRFILAILEDTANLEEDMGRHPEKWKRLGEILHPGDYSDQYPKTYNIFSKIRHGEKPYSFHSEVEKSLKDGNFNHVIALLRTRPGEFARKLDFLARSFPEQVNQIAESFSSIVEQTSSQVLLQLIAHFKNRDDQPLTRSFFPKGNIAKVQVIENTLPDLPENFCEGVVKACENALIDRFKQKPPLGKVYLDPKLQEVIVPLAQRSANRTLKTYARGSKFDLGETCQVLRAFIHWKNITIKLPPLGQYFLEEIDEDQPLSPIEDWRKVLDSQNPDNLTERQIRTDIDLSLGLYDGDWNYIEHISWTNIRSSRIEGLYHSGDIVDAPEGASEFIDMDLEKLLEKNIRYAVFNVYSYTQQGYNLIPECFFGWMEREQVNSGEIFEAKTVANKIDLTSETTICLPVVFDLEERKGTWMDLALRSNPRWVNTLEANANNVVLISRAMINLVKPNLYDLFKLNVIARGELVDDPGRADLRIGLEETHDLTPFNVETILSEFM